MYRETEREKTYIMIDETTLKQCILNHQSVLHQLELMYSSLFVGFIHLLD